MAFIPITVELVGPKMETTKADPLLVLSFATAYFRALQHVAKLRMGRGVELRGLSVIDKCIGVQSTGAQPLLIRAVTELDKALMNPFEQSVPVRMLSRARLSLPDNIMATVLIDGKPWSEISAVNPARKSVVDRAPSKAVDPAGHKPFRYKAFETSIKALDPVSKAIEPALGAEVADFQAYVLRIGGHPPSVDLIDKSAANATKVTLTGAEDTIKAMSMHLFGLVNVVAEVDSDKGTDKRTGRLLSFEPVPDVDPINAWREWFAANAVEWNDVDDVEAELEQ